MKQSPTIVLTGGGSGGHIMPLLSLAHELKELSPNCRIVYVGHKGDRFDSLNQASNFDFTAFINGGKFRRYHGESFLSHLIDIKTLALNIRDFFRVLKAVGASIRIITKFKPDVVFSKGGFVAVPVGIAARLRRVPIVTHDSDIVPGLANRLIGRWAEVNATGMPKDYYAYPSEKIHYTGIPVIATAMTTPLEAKRELGISPSSKVILISGGGHGSRSINDLVAKVAPTLLIHDPKLFIVHIAGQANKAEVSDLYHSILDKEQRQRVMVIGFTAEFDKYLSAADLVVARAGATSIAEFALQAKPCIIIPSPFLAGGHQLQNAKFLHRHSAAVILDNNVDGDELLGVLNELLGDDKRRSELSANIHKLAKPDAGQDLAKIILKVASRN